MSVSMLDSRANLLQLGLPGPRLRTGPMGLVLEAVRDRGDCGPSSPEVTWGPH